MRAEWNQYTSVVWLWKVPLVNFILAASNRQMNKKKRGEADHQTGIANGQTDTSYWPILPLACWERERGDESGRTCVGVTGVCPSPLCLLSGIWGSNWCCQTHRGNPNTHTNTHPVTATHDNAHTPALQRVPLGLKREEVWEKNSLHALPAVRQRGRAAKMEGVEETAAGRDGEGGRGNESERGRELWLHGQRPLHGERWRRADETE